MKVICIDDKNLPQGAEVVEGQEYIVERSFVNFLDQRVYIVKGIKNFGITKFGMTWSGYRAERFVPLSLETVEVEELNYIFN